MDRRTLCWIAVVSVLAFAGSGIGLGLLGRRPAGRPATSARPRRIVALSPGIAEILYAVGAGGQVVGVTENTRVPRQAGPGPAVVGGFMTPSIERIIRMRPDLAVLRKSQQELAKRCADAGIPVLRAADTSVEGLLQAVREIGAAVGRTAEGQRLAGRMRQRLDRVRASVRDRARVRVLMVLGRADATLRSLHGVAPQTLLGELVRIAGGKNVLAGSRARYPVISKEAVLVAAPEVIVEVAAPPNPVGAEAVRASWNALDAVPAVRHRRVHVLTDDHYLVPGPRTARAAEELACLLYPDLSHSLCRPRRAGPRPAERRPVEPRRGMALE